MHLHDTMSVLMATKYIDRHVYVYMCVCVCVCV